MKTRIKVIEKNNGSKVFIPQVSDGFRIANLLINILYVVLAGRVIPLYKCIVKVVESDDITSFTSNLFGCKHGEIIQCTEKEALKFGNYDDAFNFLQEYVKQEDKIKEQEKEEARIALEEKQKTVTYIKIK